MTPHCSAILPGPVNNSSLCPGLKELGPCPAMDQEASDSCLGICHGSCLPGSEEVRDLCMEAFEDIWALDLT